jgi:hypothetical protein
VRKLLIVATIGIAIGVPAGIATAGGTGASAPTPAELDDGYQRGELPMIVALEACADIAATEGVALPQCQPLFAAEEEIREEAESLPDAAPSPEDYGLEDTGGDS